MKSCWIIYNGNLVGEKFLDYANLMAEAAQKQHIQPEIIPNHELIMVIENGKAKIRGSFQDKLPDFVLFGDKDIPLAKHLEKIGLQVYNSSDSIEVCDNKIRMYQKLSDAGMKVPKTILGAMLFDGTTYQDFRVFDQIIEELGFPMVIKEAFGSFGQQVYLVHTKEEMFKKITELGSKPFLFQEFITTSYGKDVRLNVVGGEVVASMLRTSKHDFRANVTAGGETSPYQPSEQEKALAIQAAKLVGTDFAGVDLLFGEDGPIVCEVNSNAHIRSIQACTGIDISRHIISYILQDLERCR
ncbi:ATP-grasp domain-containing protein [Salirhabdus sp. Marseille-P4669]|uniref:ATP-grasp domain-containing protein n=1 Tax=Salirhabdus sp. Marseille-P4669 TaxID=2042310 RepID=UPI001F1E0EF6|nr:RimK family alpha-L-glutamate ligase [Salirhabdus sp. Marseille-P4669]